MLTGAAAHSGSSFYRAVDTVGALQQGASCKKQNKPFRVDSMLAERILGQSTGNKKMKSPK